MLLGWGGRHGLCGRVVVFPLLPACVVGALAPYPSGGENLCEATTACPLRVKRGTEGDLGFVFRRLFGWAGHHAMLRAGGSPACCLLSLCGQRK